MIFDCYVRIYLPLFSNLRPDVENPGHFDLQINTGSEKKFVIAVKEKDSNDETTTSYEFTNPIISYGKTGVVIGNASDFVLEPYQMLCKYHFTTDEIGVAALENLLEATIQHIPKESNDAESVNRFKVVVGDFTDYTIQKSNCFGATAAWCKTLGEETLQEIYDTYTKGSTGYKNYIAWTMFKKNYLAWIFDDLAV